MKKAILEITLKSDICVGSGYSYAGIIDSDAVYDRYGLPCIPGRRIKGCLREAAEEIGCVLEHKVADIFGNRGQERTGNLIVDNAHIKDYDTIVSQVSNIGNPEKISRLFSYVRAQTRMDDNGLAKEDSLRFTRVVGHYFPWSDRENVFQAMIEFDDDMEKDLTNIAKATRQIGLHRKRGLGQVKCELKNIHTVDAKVLQPSSGDKLIKIPYTLVTEEPVIISNNSDNTSETCIPGRVLLGAMAGRFLDSGMTADSDEFRNLFLDGSTIFSNAYLMIQGMRSVPVPFFVQRLKKSKKLVNVEKQKTYTAGDTNEYNPANGNQPKKLTGKYMTLNKEDAFGIDEVQTRIVYHHRHQHDIEALLYSQLVIEEGQKFIGYILTPEKYADVIRTLLGEEIRIGKSKTAQYGKCRVNIQDAETSGNTTDLKNDEIVAVALDSDAVIDNENGNTVMYADVYRSIASELGISISDDKNSDGYYSIMETGLSFGYQTVWNLRRKPLAVVKAGSVFVYHIDKDMTIDRNFVGEKNLEGFGEISIYHLDGLDYELSECDTNADNDDTIEEIPADSRFTRALEKEERVRSEKIRIQSEELQKMLDITPAALGRVTLMLRESVTEYRGNETSIYDEFIRRVDSIKTRSTSDKVKKFIDKAGTPAQKQLSDCWSDVIMTGLTYRKYLNAGKGDNA